MAPQEDVPHYPRVFLGSGPGLSVHRADGYSASGQQTLPLRLSPLFVAGGGKGRPSTSGQVRTLVLWSCITLLIGGFLPQTAESFP